HARLAHRGARSVAPLPGRLAGHSGHGGRDDDGHGLGEPGGHLPRGAGAESGVRDPRLGAVRRVRGGLNRGRRSHRGLRLEVGHVRECANRSRGDRLGTAVHRAKRWTCGGPTARHSGRRERDGRPSPARVRVYGCRDGRALHGPDRGPAGPLRFGPRRLPGDRISVEGAADAARLPPSQDHADRERSVRFRQVLRRSDDRTHRLSATNTGILSHPDDAVLAAVLTQTSHRLGFPLGLSLVLTIGSAFDPQLGLSGYRYAFAAAAVLAALGFGIALRFRNEGAPILVERATPDSYSV